MGLPHPLGPLHVSMADFELNRNQTQNVVDKGQTFQEQLAAADLPHPPLFRIYYPSVKPSSRCGDHVRRLWLPDFMYMYGYSSLAVPPTNAWNKFKCGIASVLGFAFLAPQAIINASIANSPLPQDVEGGKGPTGDGRLPVVIFTHGLWSMRTTYSTLCCDLASHGYVVVVPEHQDGSASMSRSTGPDGKTKWQRHSPFMGIEAVPLDIRVKQQRQRVAEIQAILHLLDKMNGGNIPDSGNAVEGKERLLASMFNGRLNMDRVAVCGHSFGGVTCALLAESETRVVTCVSFDAWWTPIVDAGLQITAALRPLLAISASDFGGIKLKNARNKVLQSRNSANQGEEPLVTDVLVIKGARHQDFSDLPLILPVISKKTGSSGELGGAATRLIVSRATLEFLHKHFLNEGSSFPYDASKLTESDKEHIAVGDS